jgi:hypothetical protein
MMEKLLALPTPALVALAALVVVQLSLQVFGIVDVVRRPAERLTLPKWAWAAIIVLGEILGAVLYLVAGRKPAPADEVRPATPVAERATNAADALYGERKDADRR